MTKQGWRTRDPSGALHAAAREWLGGALAIRGAQGTSDRGLWAPDPSSLATISARLGFDDLAAEAVLFAPPLALPNASRFVGAGRYDNEGISWIAAPDPRLPGPKLLAGALVRACAVGELGDVVLLLPSVDEEDRGPALWRLGAAPMEPAVLQQAARIAHDAEIVPHGLIRQLAEAGLADLALAVVAASRSPEATGHIAAGLAARGELDHAIEIATQGDTFERGIAVGMLADGWIRRHGHESAALFRSHLRGTSAVAKGRLEGSIAASRARQGDQALPTDIRALKGQAAFGAQIGAFTAAADTGHLDLAESLLTLADSTQFGYQVHVLAGAWASCGDLDRAVAIARRTRGEDRRMAWNGIYGALARAGRFDEAETFALEHLDACLPARLAWARAFQGEVDPFPRRLRPNTATDEARMLEVAALGIAGINPFGVEVYP